MRPPVSSNENRCLSLISTHWRNSARVMENPPAGLERQAQVFGSVTQVLGQELADRL
jgi:hypothetical protein